MKEWDIVVNGSNRIYKMFGLYLVPFLNCLLASRQPHYSVG